MNLRNINLDRRHKFRRVLDKFAFLQIERDDGGTVLDVSEGGLRFETFAPVLQEGPVHCWFSLNLRERIEAWGEVVWTNREKKYGGLRFLQVSEKGRGLIRECISQQTQRPIADEEYERGVGVGRAARIGVSEPDAVARFVAKARPRQGAPSNGHTIPHTWQAPAANPPTSGRHTIPRAGGAPATNLPASDGQTIPRAWEAAAANPPSFEEHTIPRAWQAPAENPPARVPLASFSGAADAGGSSTLFPPPKEMAAGRELVPAQRYHAAKRRQLILGLIFGTFVSGTVAAAIVKYSNPRHENTSAAKATAELPSQTNGGNTAPTAPIHTTVTSSPTKDVFGTGNPKKGVGGIPKQTTTTGAVGHSSPRGGEASASSPPAKVLSQPSVSTSSSQQKTAAVPQHSNPIGGSAASADVFGSGNQKTRIAEARTPSILAKETGGRPGPRASEPPSSNSPVRVPVQSSLIGNGGAQKPATAMTPKQLWAAVQAGSTKAAVELADHYIKGEGVPQNCNQARVLLLVASEKRNKEAIKKLAELDKTGCAPN